MPTIRKSTGTLAIPACGYSSEQERFEAYIAALSLAFTGGLQWSFTTAAPSDLGSYWLTADADGRPLTPKNWSTSDARWVPWMAVSPFYTSSGSANAIEIHNTEKFTTGMAFASGRRFRFHAPGTNTGTVTLKIDDLDAKAIKKHGGEDLEAGDIVEDQIVEVCYNALVGYFEITSSTLTTLPAEGTHHSAVGGVPAAGGNTSISHSGTTYPDKAEVVLRCTDADAGYAVGDEVDIAGAFFTGGGTGIPAFTVHRTTSNVVIVRSSTVTSVYLAPKGGGAAYATPITTSKWELKMRCEFWPA